MTSLPRQGWKSWTSRSGTSAPRMCIRQNRGRNRLHDSVFGLSGSVPTVSHRSLACCSILSPELYIYLRTGASYAMRVSSCIWMNIQECRQRHCRQSGPYLLSHRQASCALSSRCLACCPLQSQMACANMRRTAAEGTHSFLLRLRVRLQSRAQTADVLSLD